MCRIYKLFQKFLCACNLNAATGKDDRASCNFQQFYRFFQLSEMYTFVWFVTADIHFFRIFCRTICYLYIFRQINRYRSRFSCAGNMECHFQYLAKLCSVAYSNSIFCDSSCHSDDVNLLEGIVSDKTQRNLPGKYNKRDTVIKCICDRSDRVSRARAAGYETYSCLSGFSCISFCFMDKRLLMSRKHYINLIIPVQFVKQIGNCSSGISKNFINTFFF